ncbi:sodium:proline symporter [Oceanobacillus arenosus]|uniref:Sodium:proline symporter n=1 Tax=Oceanobacillus arenosus TaxID=1229153 RepID=A0A3D8PYV8_9BACI|nr:sodium:solute symporter family protein [Oceanobacillus arenosus]RDW21360.1 sodium:proline symporter [Oceanobacillus arenosus]
MIQNQGIYLGVFISFILMLVLIGIAVSRKVKNGEDFLMGGRGLSLPLLVGTSVATLVGTGSSMGAVGFAYSNGWAGALYGVGGSIGMFLLLYLFADVRKYNFVTYSEEMSFYYGANKLVKGLTAILLYVASIGWLGAHILGGSLYLTWITGLDPTISKILTACGFAIFTIIGGYMAVVVTDTIQGVILFLGFIFLTILAVTKIGGFSEISNQLPTEMVSFLGVDIMGIIPALSLAIVIAVGVLATPSYRHRIYSSSSISVVKKGFLISGILFAIFSFFPSVIGMSAHIMNPELESGYAFPYLATEVFPVWIGAIILTAGLSATMSSGSSDYIAGVAILLEDVYPVFMGKNPKKENLVKYSRIGLVLTLLIAFLFTIGSSSIIDYISNFVSTVMSGLFVATILGKFWPRATWQGGIACIIGGSAISFTILFNEALKAYWGNPIIPSLIGALLLGVIVSLVTPRNKISREEALEILERERAVTNESSANNNDNSKQVVM